MASAQVKERLAEDVSLWLADGVIDSDTHGVLRGRYSSPGLRLGIFIKYLGISGGLLAAFGLMGLFAVVVQSEAFVTLMAAVIAAGFFFFGIRLSIDPRGRYAHSSKVVLTLGVLALLSSLALLTHLGGAEDESIIFIVGLMAVPLVAVIAYRFSNVFLLILALLIFFHWVGSWTSMFGRSTYGTSVQDPRLMALVAAVVVGVGVFHERLLPSTSRFYLAYQALGLIYLNLSLLILSISPYARSGAGVLFYIVVLTLAALAQIILGARLKNGLLLGFGVTAMAINMFTRYHETFWDQLDAGLFFLIGGALLLGCSFAIEAFLKRIRAGVAS